MIRQRLWLTSLARIPPSAFPHMSGGTLALTGGVRLWPGVAGGDNQAGAEPEPGD